MHTRVLNLQRDAHRSGIKRNHHHTHAKCPPPVCGASVAVSLPTKERLSRVRVRLLGQLQSVKAKDWEQKVLAEGTLNSCFASFTQIWARGCFSRLFICLEQSTYLLYRCYTLTTHLWRVPVRMLLFFVFPPVSPLLPEMKSWHTCKAFARVSLCSFWGNGRVLMLGKTF